jgi:hypothetical protein
LVGIGDLAGQWRTIGVSQLPRPVLDCQCGAYPSSFSILHFTFARSRFSYRHNQPSIQRLQGKTVSPAKLAPSRQFTILTSYSPSLIISQELQV